jgi:hypothetical protein
VLLSGCALSIQFSKNSIVQGAKSAKAIQLQKHKEALKKRNSSAVFLVSGAREK